MGTCCKDCEDRKIGCHGSCDRYEEYRKFYDNVRDIKRKKKIVDNYVFDSVMKKKLGKVQVRRTGLSR